MSVTYRCALKLDNAAARSFRDLGRSVGARRLFDDMGD